MNQSNKDELREIAEYLGCNEGEFVSEVSKFIDKALSEQKKAIKEEIEKERCEVPKEPKNINPLNWAEINEVIKYAGRFNYNKAIDDALSLPSLSTPSDTGSIIEYDQQSLDINKR